MKLFPLQVATGLRSPTPSSPAPSGSGRRGRPRVKSSTQVTSCGSWPAGQSFPTDEPANPTPPARSLPLQVTPSCTGWARPPRCSGAQAPGWWSTAAASFPPPWASLWPTRSSARTTSSPSSTPSASTARVCCWRRAPCWPRPASSEHRVAV